MVRPYIADREACLQTWEVAANIFNEQSQAANNDWDSNPWDGQGAKTLAIKIHTLQNTTQDFGFGQIPNKKFISVLQK
jgi:SLT domain-containing protein